MPQVIQMFTNGGSFVNSGRKSGYFFTFYSSLWEDEVQEWLSK